MVAEKSKAELEKSKQYKDPIVTEITPFTDFYAAEDYHKNYFERNSQDPYCNFVIGPKIKKVLDKYGNDVKEEYKNPETIL
jgi:peptide-methionine (S)-S-oxide reductase